MNKIYSIIPLLCAVSTHSLAGTMGVLHDANKVITLSGGVAWTSNGTSQTVALEPDLVKSFIAQNKTSTLGNGALFFGLEHDLNPNLIYQLGLSLNLSSNATLSGSIWDDADPAFDNFFYNYKVNHGHVALKGMLLSWPDFVVQPYINGSIGVGFNHATDFTIIPKTFEQLVFPGFNSHTTTAFTYTVGVGIQKMINQYWSCGVGYEFADWGQSKLNPTAAQTIGSGLTLNHLYTHQLQASVSYHI